MVRRFPEMESRPHVTSRTRSGKTLNHVTVSDTKSRIVGTGILKAKGFFSRARVRLLRSQQKKMGFLGEKGERRFQVVVDREAKDGKDRAPIAVGCVARRTRLRRAIANDPRAVGGNAASCNLGKVGRSCCPEAVENSFESDGSDCSGCVEGVDFARREPVGGASRSKLGFGDEKKEALGKFMNGEREENADFIEIDSEEEKDNFSSDSGKEAIKYCNAERAHSGDGEEACGSRVARVAKRTRSRWGSANEHPTVSRPCVEKRTRSTWGSAEEHPTVSGYCVAKRTRSRLRSAKEHPTVGHTISIDLDELSSSSSPSSLDDDNDDDDDDDSNCNDNGENADDNDDENSGNADDNQDEDGDRGCGVSSSVDETGSSVGTDAKTIGIAQRTRSHHRWVPEKNHGTYRDPIDLDLDSEPLPRASAAGVAVDDDAEEEESDEVAVADDAEEEEEEDELAVDDDAEDEEGDEDNESNVESDDEDFEREDGGDHCMDDAGSGKKLSGTRKEEQVGPEELQFGKSTKRKRVRAPKNDAVFKLLVNTIWNKDERLPEESNSPKDKPPSKNIKRQNSEMPHPLKFSLAEETPELRDKTDSEKLEDDLWAEFNFVMNSIDIGSFSSQGVDTEKSNIPEFQTDPANLCLQGRHQFILDEEIGIKCRLCSYVKLEIKYILPSMATTVCGKSGRQGPFEDRKLSMFDRLSQDTGNESRCSFPSKGTVWDIIPGVKKTMYKHQQEGFEFMWKNLAGSIDLEELNKSASPDGLGGCVISHAPGTGKTRLAIVFLQTFMEVFPQCRPIILAPRSMLLTWENEFKKWKVDIPIHFLNRKGFSGKEDKAALQLGCNKRKNWVRLVKLFSWHKGNGILGLTYCLFEKLIGKSITGDKESVEISKILKEKTGLLVLDEGHTPRNERSLIWKALEKVKTDRRIILSGTPFQNNFGELYNTLCLVRPQFADKFSPKGGNACPRRSEIHSNDVRKSFPERRDGRGKWASLTNSIGKSTDDSLEKLRSMMDPFVHVHKGSILNSLPGLRDSVVVLHPLPLQKRILETFGKLDYATHFHEEYNASLISVHPSLLLECNLPEKDGPIINKDELESLRLNPNEGVKTRFVMELVRLSHAMNEKVLIFSQYIMPLTLLKDHLKYLFNWNEGKEVLQMDGEVTDINRRQSSIDCFNDPGSEARVLLASTKACSEGINLIGASRVVLLDVVWNPSVERQAISRAYRIGQEKVVYTYHLITSGTKEGDKYYRQAEKDRLSELLFSSTDGDGYKQQSSKVTEDKVLDEMVGHDRLKTMFEKILYQPRKSSLVDELGPAALR